MGLLGGGFLRLFQTFLYGLAFCCAGIILGIYSYFLAVLSDRHLVIANTLKAVEGISGIAVVYTILAVILTCFLGGISFFALIAIVLNVAFVGGFIALAVLTRHGADSCSGDVNTPIGNGPTTAGAGFGQNGFGFGGDDNQTYAVTLGTACRYNKACFAVSLIGAFLFLLLAGFQIVLVRHHKKEKRYGPSPANNYTSGSGKRKFWRRRRGGSTAAGAAAPATYGPRDTEMGAVDTRPSHDTAYTGSTMAAPPQTGLVKDAEPVGQPTHGHSTHGRYYTQPEGTGVNPYGYTNNTSAPARNF